MDPDLLLAIALSKSLMQEENNENNNGGQEQAGEGGGEQEPSEGSTETLTKQEEEKPAQIDRLQLYFKDFVADLIKKGGVVGDTKPLFLLANKQQAKSLNLEQYHYLAKLLEYITYLLIDGKCKELNYNNFSRLAVEFCLISLEGWSTGENALATQSTSNNNETGTGMNKDSTVMVLLSVIDMLCCSFEYTSSSEIDKTYLQSEIPSFLNISSVNDILPGGATGSEKQEEMKVDNTFKSGESPMNQLFDQFLKDGFQSIKSSSASSLLFGGEKATNISDINEALVRNNSNYFNNTLKGASRLLSICSRLLLPYQEETLQVSEKFEEFKRNETTICNFIDYVQEMLFSEGSFDTLDISAIPWIIDFIARLIGTNRSYQANDLKHSVSGSSGSQSRFLSRQLFEMIFQVLSTKLNLPELRMKAEVFFSLCILSDAEKLNQYLEKQQATVQQELILDPQLILLAINLIFEHLEELKSSMGTTEDTLTSLDGINQIISSISISQQQSNNNNTSPTTKFLISTMDNESIWFDFLIPKKFSFTDLSKLFMKSQLLDSLFSILKISFQKRKDQSLIQSMEGINSSNNVNNKESLNQSSSIISPIRESNENAEISDFFGGLFSDDSNIKTPVKSDINSSNNNNLTPTNTSTIRTSSSGKSKGDTEIKKSKFYTILSYIHDLILNQPQFVDLLSNHLKLSHLIIFYELLYSTQQPDSWTVSSNSIQKLLTSTCYLFIKSGVIKESLQNEFIGYIFNTDQNLLTCQRDRLQWIAWLFVKRQSNISQSTNDYLVVQLWTNFIQSVKNAIQESQSKPLEFKETINLEYIYFLLFSFHTLNEAYRLEIVKCFIDIIQKILTVQNHNSILSSSLLISRFLMIFNYILFNFNAVSKPLSTLFYSHLLSAGNATSPFNQKKNENYYMSLVTLSNQSLINHLEKKHISHSDQQQKLPVFYEIQFTDKSWLSPLETSSILPIFEKLSLPYHQFHSNLLLLSSLVPPSQPVETSDPSLLYYEYIVSTTLSLLYTLPVSTEFLDRMKDPTLFAKITNDSSVYLTFMKSVYTHPTCNPSLYQSIPWVQHTSAILVSCRALLKEKTTPPGVFRLPSIIQCSQSFLCSIFNDSEKTSSNTSSTTTSANINKSTDSSIEYMEGWDSLFDDDEEEEEEEDSEKKEETLPNTPEVEMKDASKSPKKERPVVLSYSELLPQLFGFLVEYIRHYKSQYRRSLASQIIGLGNGCTEDSAELLLDLFSLANKSDLILFMVSLGYSVDQRVFVNKWDDDYNLDDSQVSKNLKQHFGWILQQNGADNTGSIQYLIKSQITLSNYAMSHYRKLSAEQLASQGYSNLSNVSTDLLCELFPFPIDKKYSFTKNRLNWVNYKLTPAQNLFLGNIFKLSLFDQISAIVLKISSSQPALLGNTSLHNLLISQIDQLLLIAKSSPSHIYSYYITNSVTPFENTPISYPIGDIALLFWIVMNISNESLNEKVLVTFNYLLSIPTPTDFLTSLRSLAIESLSKLPLPDLNNWFEQKLLGKVSSTEGEKKYTPTTTKVQELIVKFLGLLMNNKELSQFSADALIPPAPEKEKEVEEEEESDKKKKPAKKASSTPPLGSSSPSIAATATPIEPDWNEKLPDMKPLILDILLASLQSAFNEWINYPRQLKGYFSLLQYIDIDQHQMLRLYKEISSLSSSLYTSPSTTQLESLNYILEFMESVLDMIDRTTSSTMVSNSNTTSNPVDSMVIDSKPTRSHENILYDPSEEDLNLDDENNYDDDDDKDWKSSPSQTSGQNEDEDPDASEEKKLASKLCTYSFTKNEYIDQHWYFCYTCGLKMTEGCCSVCVKVCHKGHVVSYSRFSRFFCDCGAGAGKGGGCKALKPRPFTPSKKDTNSGHSNNNSSPHIHEDETNPSTQQYFFNIPNEKDKEDLKNEIAVNQSFQSKVSELYPKLVELYKSINNICQPVVSEQNLNTIDLFTTPSKELIIKSDLFSQKKASKSAYFDAKLKLDGVPDGNQLKTLIQSGPIQRTALVANSRGIIAVAEQDSVSLINTNKILDEDIALDKNSLKVISKSNVGFPIVSMIFNPENERFLAVIGYKDCKILTLNEKDEVVDQLPIELSLEYLGETNYIIKAEWIIGSQVELIIVTNEFIKVYDLSKDNLSPSHFFSLLEDSIRDMCLILKNNKNYILALSATGLLYTQCIDPNMDDNESCIMIETIQLPVVKSSPGVVIFNAHELDMVIVTFTNGEAYGLEINDSVTAVKRSFPIQDPIKKTAMPSQYFLQLSPVQPYVFTALSTRSGFLITFKLGANNIQLQSIKLTLKVEGMVWINKSTSPKLLVLFDDGSLMRYDYTLDLLPSTNTVSTVKESKPTETNLPSGLDIMAFIKHKQANSSKPKLETQVKTSSLANLGQTPNFPVDFFEKVECITGSIKFGGDPLKTFTQEVIKQKLSSNDEYIVCNNLDSLSLIIYNNDQDFLICGIRVLLGHASTKHIPTELKVYNRVIPVTEGMRRWYDIPFTNDETLKSAKRVTLIAGATFTMGNAPIIDQVEVYACNKDSLNRQDTTEKTSGTSVNIDELLHSAQISPVEQSLLYSLKSMYSYFSIGVGTTSPEYQKLKQYWLSKLPEMMTDTKLSFARTVVKELLKILTGDHDSYLNLKHSTLLRYTSQTLSGMSKLITGNSIILSADETDTLEYIVKVLKKIITIKPKNLIEYLVNDKPNFLVDLVQIYRLAIQSAFTKNNTTLLPSSYHINTLLSDRFISDLTQLIWYSLKLKLYPCNYIFDLVKSLLSHPSDIVRSKTSISFMSLISQHTPDDSTIDVPPVTSSSMKKDEDVQMEDQVLFFCDNCQKPIQEFRWSCDDCGDYDLCGPCYSQNPHEKTHKFSKHPVEEVSKQTLEETSSEMVVEKSHTSTPDVPMNLEEEDEDLKLAISMSLSDVVVEEPQPMNVSQTTVNEENEDSILLLFKYTLNELVSVYDKGFNSVLPYLQLTYSLLFNHYDKIILRSPNNSYIQQFVKSVIDLLSRQKKQLEKYLAHKSLPLESDCNLFLLLSLLLDSDLKSAPTSLPHTAIYSLSNLFLENRMLDLAKLWLETIFTNIQKTHLMGDAAVDSPFGGLLQVHQSDNQNLPKSRYSPFFTKSLPRDQAGFIQTITKSIFKLVITFFRCEKRKQSLSSTSDISLVNRNNEWIGLSCGFIHSKKASATLEQHPKRLLLLICQTKAKYFAVRDEYLLKKKYHGIVEIEKATKGFTGDINYDQLTKLISSLSLMLEVASDRPKSWQYFVTLNSDVLSNLFNILFKLDPEPTSLLLELLTYAFVDGNNNNNSESMDIDAKSKHVSIFMNENLLNILIYNLLLESNSSELRSNASNFLYYLWKSSTPSQKLQINRLFWSKLDKVVAYGKNSNDFMELLTYFINETDATSWKDQYAEFSDKFITSFQSQNSQVLNHPNSQIYNSLSFILDFEDYYLESEPCLVCNNPEVQYQTVKLESLKQEVKFTESTQLVKFNGVYSIQKLTINIQDSKKGKMIKSINLYYNNKPVNDIGDLKGKFNQWKKLKQVHFAPSQTERTIQFQIPISARNFMIEYFDFHDNLQVMSSEKLTCPRCSRIVTDKHGICKHCHENAFQCKQCRNINYENLDGFLCNECGYCKHAKFEYTFTCKPTVSIEKIENQEDHKRAIQTIDKESENAHKKYQKLIHYKKIIADLITSLQTQEPWPKEQLFLSQTTSNPTTVPPTTAAQPNTNNNGNTFSALRINKKIGYISRIYEKECKTIFEGLSKSVQILQTNRIEIAKYVHSIEKHHQKLLSGSNNSNNNADDHIKPKIRDPNNCFGCSNSFIEQCLSFLNHLSRNPNLTELKEILITKGLHQEIFVNNIHHGKSISRANARLAISNLSKSNLPATVSLNKWIGEKIDYALDHYHNVDIPNLISSELLLLKNCSTVSDQFWQTRFKFIMEIFFKSIERGSYSPVISEFIILPCLKIILSISTLDSNVPKKLNGSTGGVTDENQKSLQSKFEKLKSRRSPEPQAPTVKSDVKKPTEKQDEPSSSSSQSSTSSSQSDISLFESEPSVKYEDWLNNPDAFDQWTSKYSGLLTTNTASTASTGSTSTSTVESTTPSPTKQEKRELYLATKYFGKWKANLKKNRQQGGNTLEGLFEGSWVKKLLFNSTSSIRTATLTLMGILSKSSPVRTLRFLDLFEKMIPYATTVGEYSEEFFDLFNKIIQSEERKLYLTVRGFIPYLCNLIVSEIERIKSKESSFNSDVSQGFVLKTLVSILQSFMEVNTIKLKMKRDNIMELVLDAFLSLRGLIIQKNKLTEDSVKALQDMMKTLNTESVEDNKIFMAANIKALGKYSHDGRTPIFIYEQLCNIVCPTKPEPVYQLILNKSSTQEEFIRGSMNRNPYSSASIGPLMRDVKNKICKTLDLGSFLDDDNGMELLVDNKIIKLDLPINKVFEQVWRRSAVVTRSGDQNHPMTVVYRLQGLDGEATEEIIENLPDTDTEEKDPEVEFAITSVFAECGGLNAMLLTIESINDFTVEKELAQLVVKLLFSCCKIKVNRQKLITINTVSRLLEKLKHAFHQPDIAENLLIIIESVVSEANRDYNLALSGSGSNLPTQSLSMVSKDCSEAQAQMLMFLDKLNSPLVRSNPKIINAMTRIIPFLTYGHASVMESLLDFFSSYLDFASYDSQFSKDTTYTYHLDFIARVTEYTRPDSNGFKLRTLAQERGITQSLVDYIHTHFPEDKDKTSKEWSDSLQLPALPYVLVLFRGLAMGHEPTQSFALKSGIIKRIHILEETSTSAKIGSLSENLLEALMEGNEELTKVIKNIRKESRMEKLKAAEKHREDVLKELGLSQQGKHITASTVPGSIEDLEEDEGFTCMVCREGFAFKPEEVMGIYTYSKRIPLLALNETTLSNNNNNSSNSSTVSYGYTTVTHFNIIHFQCHREATKADRAMKVPKEEWEGAALRNQQTKCNNIFPILGPQTNNDQFAKETEKYFSILNGISRIDGSRFRVVAHDLKLLIIKFAKDESFSIDSKGGGKESNIRIIPFFVQLGMFLLDQKIPANQSAANQLRRPQFEKLLSQFLTMPLETAAQSMVQSTSADNTPYFLVLSLFLLSPKEWEANKFNYLTRILLYAFTENMSLAKPTTTEEQPPIDTLFNICRPWLIFYSLVLKFHELLRPQSLNLTDDNWLSQVKSHMANNYLKIQTELKSLLAFYHDELKVYIDHSEFFDSLELLKPVLDDSKDANQYLLKLYQSAKKLYNK